MIEERRIGYSQEYIKLAKEEFLKQFNLLIQADYGKIEIHFNKMAKIIEIVPSPHIKIKGDLTKEKI